MTQKPSLPSIKTYAADYAAMICDDFFDENNFINGPQIVKLSHVRQVNLLVVKNIFWQWQQETKKLESPLFNYQTAQVQEALMVFMNTLSNNIQINRKNFQKILFCAVSETLELLLYPQLFFKNLFNSLEETIDLQNDAYPILKYVKVHIGFLEKLKAKFQFDGQFIERTQALRILQDTFEQHADLLDFPHDLLQQFDEDLPVSALKENAYANRSAHFQNEGEPDGLADDVLSGVNVSEEEHDFFDEKTVQEISEEFDKPFGSTPTFYAQDDEDEYAANQLKSEFDPINDNTYISNQEDILNTGVSGEFTPSDSAHTLDIPPGFLTDAPSEDNILPPQKDLEANKNLPPRQKLKTKQEHLSADITKPATPNRPAEPAVSAKIEPKQAPPKQPQEDSTQNKKIDREFEELIAKRQPKEKTLLDRLRANQFKKLTGNIPLHQKFRFKSRLFGDNEQAFEEAIELIDKAPDYHEALKLIKSKFVLKYDWDFSDETTLEFIGMVEEKYD